MKIFNDEDYIRNPDQWPGETLCLKRKAKENEAKGSTGYAAFGVITSCNEPVVIHLRGRTPANDFEDVQTYPSIVAMLADGWIID